MLELKTSAPVLVSHDAKPGAATNGAKGTSTPAARRLTGARPPERARTARVCPARMRPATPWPRMPVSLTVSGSYENLTHFLDRAENLPRAWLIDKLTAAGGASGKQEISLTAVGRHVRPGRERDHRSRFSTVERAGTVGYGGQVTCSSS